MSHFSFHLAKYREACKHLSSGQLTVDQFHQWDDIREASATAIALEQGLIEVIPADGRLPVEIFWKVIAMIKQSESD